MSNKVSIDIGSKYIHIAEGDYQKGLLTVRRSQSFEIPSNTINNEAIKDVQLLGDTVTRALKSGEFKSKEAILTVNGTQAIIREIDLPKAKPKELDSMVKNEMHQTFHVLNTDIIQYKGIQKVVDNDGTALDRYRVAALDRDFVDGYFKALDYANMKAFSMDLNMNAIDKLLNWADSINDKKIEENAVMLIDFGHTFMTIYIYSKDQTLFYRHLNNGSQEIDTVLMSTFYKQESDAKSLKEKTAFFDQSADSIPYFEALKPFLYHMNDEIRRLTTFYVNHFKSISIDHCFLFGQGSELMGLAEYLGTSLNIPTEKLQSLSKANTTIKINPAHLNAIAALIRS